MSRKLKIFLLTLILMLIPFIAIRAWYFLTDNFYPEGIQNDFAYNPDWDVPPLSLSEKEALKASLSKPLTYLNKGAQIFAFQTEDGKYVLKFFKFKHSKPSYFVEVLPPIGPLKKYKEEKRIKKLDKIALLFKGHIDAYKHDKEDTGLVYLHLNKTQHDWNMDVTISDKLGRKFSVSLDDHVFVIQKKGIVLRDALRQSLKAGKVEQTTQELKQIVDLYMREYKKGIYDCDHGLTHNTGFTFEGNAFRFDVGKSCYGEEFKSASFIRKDMDKVLAMMSEWLRDNFKTVEPKIMSEVRRYADDQIDSLESNT